MHTGTLNYLGSQESFPKEVTVELMRNEEKLSRGRQSSGKDPGY